MDRKVEATNEKIASLAEHKVGVELDHLDVCNLPTNFKVVQTGSNIYSLDFTNLGAEYVALLDSGFRRDMRLGPRGLVHLDAGSVGPASKLNPNSIKDNLRFRVKVHEVNAIDEKPGCAVFKPVILDDRTIDKVARALSLKSPGVFSPATLSPSLLNYLLEDYDVSMEGA